MKKGILFIVVLLLVLNVAAFADRNAIDAAIQAYEAIVTEAESVAQRPLIAVSDVAALEERAQAVGPMIQAIENEREWAISDVRHLAELNDRFNRAMTDIAKKLLQF